MVGLQDTHQPPTLSQFPLSLWNSDVAAELAQGDPDQEPCALLGQHLETQQEWMALNPDSGPWITILQFPQPFFHVNPPWKGPQALSKAPELLLLLPLPLALGAPPQSKTKVHLWPRVSNCFERCMKWAAAASVVPGCLENRSLLREVLSKTLLPFILFSVLADENLQIHVVCSPAPNGPEFAP